MTIVSDPDRHLDLPHVTPDRGPCPPWCKDHGDHDRDRDWTYGDLDCCSDELFIPYADSDPISVEKEFTREDGDSTDSYPPFVPSYLMTYLTKSHGQEQRIHLGRENFAGLTLTLGEARDLREALGRLLDRAGESRDR